MHPLAGVMALSCAFLATLVLCPLAIRVGHRWDLLDRPGQHKQHAQPTPFLGGLVLFAAVWIGMAVMVLSLRAVGGKGLGPLLHVFAGAVIIVGLGLVDDLRPVRAWVKLVIQAAVGVILFLGGLHVDLLIWPTGALQTGPASIAITVIWVVVLTNAVNLIDGLDGLAGGVSLIAAIALLVIGVDYGVGWPLLILWLLVGFLAPFLHFNRYPARLFLGDSGSLQIGYYFAAFTLLVNFKSFATSALFLPLVALGVPLLETATSFARRILSGRPVMKADRRHLFHYLSMVGLSPRRIVLVFNVLGVVFGLIAIAMYLWRRTLVLALLLVFMVVILALFYILVSGLPARVRQRRRSVGQEDRAGDGE